MKCEVCGNNYIQRECPYCDGTFEDEPKIIKTLVNTKVILLLISAITSIGLFSIYTITQNPILGKWKSEKRLPVFGYQNIEFKKDTMNYMGMIEKVDYEIDGKEISVTDATGVGAIYTMIDENTISSKLMGLKSTFKRVE